MKFIIAILALMLGGVSSVFGQEITATEDFFNDYEVISETEYRTQKAEGTLPKPLILVGDEYFGICFRKGQRNIYNHYDESGSMLWSTRAFDYNPLSVSLSPSGNRVMAIHVTDTTSSPWTLATEVYDAVGNHLFTLDEHGRRWFPTAS